MSYQISLCHFIHFLFKTDDEVGGTVSATNQFTSHLFYKLFSTEKVYWVLIINTLILCIFPADFKVASISPIHEDDSKVECSNCRPIYLSHQLWQKCLRNISQNNS